MYPDPYNTISESEYWGGADPLLPTPCPVCGGVNGCVGQAPVALAHPPVDVPDTPDSDRATGPLRPYAVTVFGYTTVMRLDDRDAAFYGDAATPIT